MSDEHGFVDYYAILEVSPECDAKTLEASYRRLAKSFHPDHRETADIDKFNAVIAAYRVLRTAPERSQYDAVYFEIFPRPEQQSTNFDEAAPQDVTALTDAEAHERILQKLYKKRRETAHSPGVLAFYIKQDLRCSEDLFEFYAWYLKAKGFIERTEQNELAITVEGIDHVIAMSRTSAAAQLRIARPDQVDEHPDMDQV